MTRELPQLINLEEAIASRVDGDIVVHGYLNQAARDMDSSDKGGSFEENVKARELLQQWEHYADASTQVYKKLYPVPRRDNENAS